MKFLNRSGQGRLVLLTFGLAGLLVMQNMRPSPKLTEEGQFLYRKILAGQQYLWSELRARGVSLNESEDIYRSGFIGVEWSPLTTTLGSLEAKRSSTDPLWGVQILRWFDELKLQKGDRIVVLSSSSFPGMLFAVLAASELRGLKVDLVVSLGASTWGANRPEAPWPVLAFLLQKGGFLVTRPVFYTLGGGGEIGGGLSQEALELLKNAAAPVELFQPKSLLEVIKRKQVLIEAPSNGAKAKLVVDIGGSAGNMGTDAKTDALMSGLIQPNPFLPYGNGAVGFALQKGYPVLKLLDLKELALAQGIAFDARADAFAKKDSLLNAFLGIVFFAVVVFTHQRWTWGE